MAREFPQQSHTIGTQIMLAIAGLLLSMYSTLHHIRVRAVGFTDSGCHLSSTINCDKTVLSPFSEPMGTPLGIWGTGFFLSLFVLLAVHFRTHGRRATLSALCAKAVVLHVTVGAIISLGLAGISIGLLRSLCPVCAGIYLVSWGLFELTIYNHLRIPPAGRFAGQRREWLRAGLLAVVSPLLSLTVMISAQPGLTRLIEVQSADEIASAGLEQLIDYENPPTFQHPAEFDHDIKLGSLNAPIVIVEFVDFECPNCALFSQVNRLLHREYAGYVATVFKHFPMDPKCNPHVSGYEHEFACKAAILAECSFRLNIFLSMHDWLFAHQWELTDINLFEKALAREPHNAVALSACLSDPSIKAKIDADISLAAKIGISATPGIFINGRRYIGPKMVTGYRKAVNLLRSRISKVP